MKPSNSREPPINVGEEHTGRVDSVGEKGDGVVRIKGFVVFVPKVERGDFIKIKITKVLPKVAFGEAIEKVEPPKPPAVQKKEKQRKELEEFLTTEGDSEDFGEEDDEDK